jgi:hypothetical protein
MTGSKSNTVVQGVNPWRASTTTVCGAPNPSPVGQLVSMTAVVGPVGPPTPTSTVSFTLNGNPISGCTAIPLSPSLSAIFADSTLPVGNDQVLATYSGDANYCTSSGLLTDRQSRARGLAVRFDCSLAAGRHATNQRNHQIFSFSNLRRVVAR